MTKDACNKCSGVNDYCNVEPEKDLTGCFIGVELVDGTKIFGTVEKWSKATIWVNRDDESTIDIPRSIIIRTFISLK